MVWFRDDRQLPRRGLGTRRRGRKAAYKPVMTLDQARSRCSLRSPWYEREAHTPCYGKSYPRLETDQEKRLWRLLNELRAALALAPREASQRQRDVSSREERIDAVQVPDDPSEKQDTNSLVEGELRRNPNARSKEIAEAIERADQTVRQTRAWKANRQRLKELSQQRPVRTVPLTNAMLVVTDSKAGDSGRDRFTARGTGETRTCPP